MPESLQTGVLASRTIVRGVWQGGKRTAVYSRLPEPILVDEPAAVGGDDLAPRPTEYLLAALAGSVSVLTSIVAAEMDFHYSALESDISGWLDLRGVHGTPGVHPGLREVSLTVMLQTSEPPARLATLAGRVEERSPILYMLRASGAEVAAAWQTRDPAGE